MTASAHPTPAHGQVNEPEETTAQPAQPAEPQEQDDASPQARVRELEEENAKLRDQWVRAVAETDNVRKRAQKAQEETSKYAVTDFAESMVSVLENLTRAAESIPAELKAGNDVLKNLGEGVELTLRELLSIFEKYGIKRLDPLGQKFDHNVHQAVAQVPQADAAPGTVIQVVQAGYIIHDRLLKPAMVVVAAAMPKPSGPVDTSA